MSFILLFGLLFLNLTLLVCLNLTRAVKIATILLNGGVVLFLSYKLSTFNSDIFFFQDYYSFEVLVAQTSYQFSFGFDALSLQFCFLSAILTFFCLIFIWQDANFLKYSILLLVIEFFLFVIFLTLDLLMFYAFFEAILIPMYFLIGLGGSRARKIRAAYLFFFYTLVSSVLFLIGVIYIYELVGSFDLEYIYNFNFNVFDQRVLWLVFFLSFASKIPMFPFHIWLPEAHVEAPTIGSVLLAGILLKLGVYGFIRFSLTFFTEASIYFSPIVFLLSLFGIIYASLSALRQTDIKRIIAYSSVAHMNLVTLGIFSFNVMGVEGSIFQSLSHGFVSGGLFLLIGVLYDRYHTRFLYYYGGLVHMMPLYSIFLVFFTMANIALPGTSSFVGEFLLLIGIFNLNSITGIIATSSVILGGAYSLWLLNRLLFGNLKLSGINLYQDVNSREFYVLIALSIFILALGLYPSFCLVDLDSLGILLNVLSI